MSPSGGLRFLFTKTGASVVTVLGSVGLWCFGLRCWFQRRRTRDSVAFFHPFCDGMGGGERVLWCLVRELLQGSGGTEGPKPRKVVVYYDASLLSVKQGKNPFSPRECLERVRERFHIDLTGFVTPAPSQNLKDSVSSPSRDSSEKEGPFKGPETAAPPAVVSDVHTRLFERLLRATDGLRRRGPKISGLFARGGESQAELSFGNAGGGLGSLEPAAATTLPVGTRTPLPVQHEAQVELEFVPLYLTTLLLPECYPRLTLLLQSLGSIVVALEALWRFTPVVFVDTVGYAFTGWAAKWLAGCRFVAYTHYPTISSDMLRIVRERRVQFNNKGTVVTSFWGAGVKLAYYHAFSILYALTGALCWDRCVANSTWTYLHLVNLMGSADTVSHLGLEAKGLRHSGSSRLSGDGALLPVLGVADSCGDSVSPAPLPPHCYENAKLLESHDNQKNNCMEGSELNKPPKSLNSSQKITAESLACGNSYVSNVALTSAQRLSTAAVVCIKRLYSASLLLPAMASALSFVVSLIKAPQRNLAPVGEVDPAAPTTTSFDVADADLLTDSGKSATVWRPEPVLCRKLLVLLGLAIPQEKLGVVYPPCDTRPFEEAAARCSERANRIVSLAQFRPEKNHRVQLEAFQKLLSKFIIAGVAVPDDLELVLCGATRHVEDEKIVQDLKTAAVQLGIENRCRFLVNAPFRTIVELLASSKVGIHTMVAEHFGIAIVEMLAAGMSVVAHNSAGPRMDILNVSPFLTTPSTVLGEACGTEGFEGEAVRETEVEEGLVMVGTPRLESPWEHTTSVPPSSSTQRLLIGEGEPPHLTTDCIAAPFGFLCETVDGFSEALYVLFSPQPREVRQYLESLLVRSRQSLSRFNTNEAFGTTCVKAVGLDGFLSPSGHKKKRPL